jgi:hypothetical protein
VHVFDQYRLTEPTDDRVKHLATVEWGVRRGLGRFNPKDIPTLDPSAGTFGLRLAQNAPIAAPLLIAQGLTDIVVFPEINDTYVDQRCAAAQRLEHRHVPGRYRGGLVPGQPAHRSARRPDLGPLRRQAASHGLHEENAPVLVARVPRWAR